MEIWKDIRGYEGYYKCSNTGLIKSLERKILIQKEGKRPYWYKISEKILNPNITKTGIYAITLSMDAISNTFSVGNIIYKTFFGLNLSDKREIIKHHDKDVSNCRLENLYLADGLMKIRKRTKENIDSAQDYLASR